jgi:hypothetical protein
MREAAIAEGAPEAAVGAPARGYASPFLAAHPAAYAVLMVISAVSACLYGLRVRGIFACPASAYSADQYLAYCQAAAYGDYDYGGFWFGLEPAARQAAANADVLFLGNSRMQFGLSTRATSTWFADAGVRPYLLGFSYNGNHLFASPLLRSLQPHAKAYVINLDLFFEASESPPALEVTRDVTARARYEQKQVWQRVHQGLCGPLRSICGEAVAFYRSRSNGAWRVVGGNFNGTPVAFRETLDSGLVASYSRAGSEFLSSLAVRRECIILTYVPTRESAIGDARAIATALGATLIAPALDALTTFDGSHLDSVSAERWSGAFLAEAGDQIKHCVGVP